MAGLRGHESLPIHERVALWNEALLEELLPLQPQANTSVLLACDDETLRAAGEQLGIEPTEAADEFAQDVRNFFEVGLQAGFKFAVGGEFDKQPRPRPLPDFFALLCLWVLAASHMGADERYPTSEYYGRLNALLKLRGDDQLPQFEFIGPLFERLAKWLEQDLRGTRGRLLIPENPHPKWLATQSRRPSFAFAIARFSRASSASVCASRQRVSTHCRGCGAGQAATA